MKMNMKNFMTAEKKAFAAFAISLAAIFGAIVLRGEPVFAQPEGEHEPGSEPGMSPGGPPPGGREDFRDNMRRRREERREEFRREYNGGGGREDGGPRGMGQGRLGRYLDVVQSYQTAVQDEHQAVGLAALGIKDHYRRSGKPLDAVRELDEVLKTTTDQKMRNILLFTIRQIYEEQKAGDKFMEVSRQIIRENLKK